MTILVAELVGGYVIQERLSPEELTRLINDLLVTLHRVIVDRDGQLMCQGPVDATLAIFSGAAHAQRAVQAAAQMMDALRSRHVDWESAGLPALEVAIGVNSGRGMVMKGVGLFEPEHSFALGDNVNLAGQLAGINRHYGTRITLSEFAYQPIRTECTARELDLVMVKGKRDPVRIFELWTTAPPTREQAERRLTWDRALSAYRTQRWDAAIDFFSKSEGDFAASMYLQRCQALKSNPPGPKWNGVWTGVSR